MPSTEFIRLKKANCVNCYKCIRHCPVKAIRFSGGQAHIINNECILCGHCFVVCPQNAKEIVDGTEVHQTLEAPAHIVNGFEILANEEHRTHIRHLSCVKARQVE